MLLWAFAAISYVHCNPSKHAAGALNLLDTPLLKAHTYSPHTPSVPAGTPFPGLLRCQGHQAVEGGHGQGAKGGHIREGEGPVR